MSVMSSPLRRHTKRFAGSVKNLVYRLYPQGVSSPQMIDSIDTRQTDDDYCSVGVGLGDRKREYCENGGRCYSSNDGPMCDCSLTDFNGPQCQQSKTFSEHSIEEPD